MEELEILRVLNKYNPWWSNKEIPPSKISEFKRGDFHIVKGMLSKREIISVIGPRRVGKTILIHQLIYDLLQSGISPSRILYLSVDEFELKKGGAEIKDVFEVYSKYIAKKPLDSLQEIHYLFLDEIQEIPSWEKILKNWYDLGYNLKFIISGSSSIWIHKGTEESLLGRIKTTVMMPLKFSEVLRYRGIIPEDFCKTINSIKEAFIRAAEDNKPDRLIKELEKFMGDMILIKDKIMIELNRYIIVGGYPEFLEEKDYSKISESIRDKIKLIFFKDIIRYFKIRNPEVLEDLFKLLSKNSGGNFNIAKTAGLLDIQRPTLKDYLKYLTKAYLIKNSEFYSMSRKTRIRKQEKIYVLDPGIRNAIIDYLDDTLLKDREELGTVIEGIIFDHLIRFKFNLEKGPEPEIFYWKNKKEIDFVLAVKRKPVPIESKNRKNIKGDVYETIDEFTDENKSPFGIVITMDEFAVKGKIIEIPFWAFLVMI